ncbi:hypothetical protein HanXRQr2_Chr15g0722361 [Helianthus annuus]|uniref:Uncharacterized protein n=1 Tax=Helianthus annuus TaxID=4232 RepID=A0A9K3E518_HELAN|nr:hypothetical protein HanXRQr2_Chr15g0722361 [Helianthus annuus]KAJ0458530.1 hypothetical protein HanIR_Chr15g0786111 [Helianthus annuus]KAJ0833649.1 hypothetical protein HanPSC8_Chr15g0692831 [Helianthus annuus]
MGILHHLALIHLWINNMSTDSSTEANGSKVSMEPMLELGRSR